MARKKNDENSFVFYRSFYDVMALIPDEAMRCRAYTAICEYAFNGKEPAEEEDVLVKMVFTQAKPQIDANAKRRENGKAGGRAKKEAMQVKAERQRENHPAIENGTGDVPEVYQHVTTEVPNVNDNVNANENVNDNDNANEKNSRSGKPADAERVISDGQAHFTPPTHTQVLDYIAEKELIMDADRFIDYYTANGWMIGKNRMRDWKAAVRSWARQEERYQNGRTGTQNIKTDTKGEEKHGTIKPQLGLCL